MRTVCKIKMPRGSLAAFSAVDCRSLRRVGVVTASPRGGTAGSGGSARCLVLP
jgi:hypothetical protein